MFKNKLMKIVGASILLFILTFSLMSGVCANNSTDSDDSIKDLTLTKFLYFEEDIEYDLDDSDNLDDFEDWDDSDYLDDFEDWDDSDYLDDFEDWDDYSNYYEWEWNGVTYFIDLDQFNLTDEELTELFTKRDALMEEIDNLDILIQEMELSRNNNTLLSISTLYDAINNITNKTEFNKLLLSLNDVNINNVNVTLIELKKLLESIKSEYPSENFTDVDYFISLLEDNLFIELEKYMNLTSERDTRLAELADLFDNYPFLMQNTKYASYLAATSKMGITSFSDSKNDSKNHSKSVSDSLNQVKTTSFAEMKTTGIPYFPLVTLIVLLGLFGFNIKRKF
ncbi:MAG: hypothetical protein ISP01_01045 [Methanobrevibacter arboriphilus]|uniref:Uncharacterized protein n=2 Tax=Methanobrevibacter arboriphilus TaxID=39441 RepID=A0A843A9I7_METAZ|nr:hypothetical protein [Methanobrevibacter arboriphilus]MBF4467967.1 hypothetical protein [Methanobrevibacter arboriphilus]